MAQPRIAPVAVDAMGGDFAPAAVVQGAANAARNGHPVILVGDENKVRAELGRIGAGSGLPLTLRHASEVVEMCDHPGQAMRRKKDNSIRVCFELVKAGEASAMVSAGNSGAVLAGAMFVLGRIEGVDRPAIVTVLPGLQGRTLMLDMGAVVDCKPVHLVQFALMGEVYSRRVLGKARPRVAILSNGEEDSKGTELTRAALAALRRAPIDFHGYCEGRDLLTGEFDVVVTDGFTGNVALKTMEGTAKVIGDFLKQGLKSNPIALLGGALASGALRSLKKRLDWREIGGAPLVGVQGLGFISHGRSDAIAVENAIVRAEQAALTHFTDEIARAVSVSDSLLTTPTTSEAPPAADDAQPRPVHDRA